MKKGICHAARLLAFDASGDRCRYRKTFITLTYRDARDWSAKHISEFRNRLHMWCKRKGIKFRFVWCSELQQRGAVHYHFLCWIPRRFKVPKPDEQGWWTHGDSNIKEAQCAVAYIAKYASKTDESAAGKYPKGARMYGAGGLDSESRRALRYWQAPVFVRTALTGRADIRKVKGGYCDKFTGEFLPSPWHIEFSPGGMISCWRELSKPETVQ